uniref:DNA-directed RNA polymerase I subunit RPA34 isoform X2 n=1 Tax=Myxine glutinosa TaxID=7769 RepID=UPI00358EB642
MICPFPWMNKPILYESSLRVPRSRKDQFECPEGFELTTCEPLRGFCADKLAGSACADAELWLIKTPATFDPTLLMGRKVQLCADEVMSVQSGPSTYKVMAKKEPSELSLLLPSTKTAGLLPTGSFCGNITITEDVGGLSSTVQHPIPPSPVPKLPSGLKQRFRPFGILELEEQSHHAPPSLGSTKERKTYCEAVEEVIDSEHIQKRKKRKKKKKKRICMDDDVPVAICAIKVEEEKDDDTEGGDVVLKKNKSKKKNKERVEAETMYNVIKEEDNFWDCRKMVKEEPLSDGPSDVCFKKERKRKRYTH